MKKTDSGSYKLSPEEMAALKQQHEQACEREREAKYTLSQVGLVVGGLRNAVDSMFGNAAKVRTLLSDLEHVIETQTEKQ